MRFAVAGFVTCELIGLNRRAERYDFVRIHRRQRRLAKMCFERSAYVRCTRCATDQHHAIDVARLQLCVAQRALNRCHCAINQRLRERGKGIARNVNRAIESAAPVHLNRGDCRVGQRFFGRTRCGKQIGLSCGRKRSRKRPRIEGVFS